MVKRIKKTTQQIEYLRIAGGLHNELQAELMKMAQPGISLIDLEVHAKQYIASKKDVKATFLGHHGYPAVLCLSVNSCVVHGIPDKSILKNGDLLKIDLGLSYKGMMVDAAVSVIVGGNDKNAAAANLLLATKTSLDEGLLLISAGESFDAYARSVSATMKRFGCAVIRDLVGHGVGTQVWESPHVYNHSCDYTRKGYFEEGMVLALEPITAERSTQYTERPGNTRNLYTKHGDLGAQREYTILVTKGLPELIAGIK